MLQHFAQNFPKYLAMWIPRYMQFQRLMLSHKKINKKSFLFPCRSIGISRPHSSERSSSLDESSSSILGGPASPSGGGGGGGGGSFSSSSGGLLNGPVHRGRVFGRDLAEHLAETGNESEDDFFNKLFDNIIGKQEG